MLFPTSPLEICYNGAYMTIRKFSNLMFMEKYKLNAEEQEILDYFESGSKLSRAKVVNAEKEKAANAARNFLKKTERINIRMNAFDLNHIKRRAAEEGIPYQTLISSILHKYASGFTIK